MTHGYAQHSPRERPPATDHQVSNEVCDAWRRAGVIGDGEVVVGFVAIIGLVGHHSDGREYQRICRVVPPGTHRGDARKLLTEGLELAPTSEAAPDLPWSDLA